MIKRKWKILFIMAISTVLAAALYVAQNARIAPEASSSQSRPDLTLWRDTPLTLQIQIPPDSTLDEGELQTALSKMEPYWTYLHFPGTHMN
jgi:hypothetical protein